MPFIMNNERYNPHLSSYIRNNKPQPLSYESKEIFFSSVYARDGYFLNSENARWRSENNRTRFAELNDKGHDNNNNKKRL